MTYLTCRDCGQHHETGGDALRCDHERQVERVALNGGLHALDQVRDCPVCQARSAKPERRSDGDSDLLASRA